MALLQKKPQVSSSAPLYTLGQNKVVLLVGLGNPGKEYKDTRHNLGFMCQDAFVAQQDWNSWVAKKDLKCSLASGNVGDTKIIAIKPSAFMNESGQAVRAAVKFYKIAPENILVVHDELDIPFGQIRTRKEGSSAGHNGVDSVINHIGKKFGRVRIGIQNEHSAKADSADFVLSKFTKDEQRQVPTIIKEVVALLNEYIYSGQLPTDTRNVII